MEALGTLSSVLESHEELWGPLDGEAVEKEGGGLWQ